MLPLLIAKRENQNILPDDYKLGWLFQDDKDSYWMIWGSSKDRNTALCCAKDTLQRQGNRDVFIFDLPLSLHPTKEQISKFEKVLI